MKITHCQVNHIANPVGYRLERPVFHWTVEDAKGTKAESARIVIRKKKDLSAGSETSPAGDTGWGAFDSLAVPVDLKPEPRTRYVWTVSVRTDAGEEAASAENYFETGKMGEPWTASWIGCDDSEPRHPVFSRKISAGSDIAAARLYITGLGLYEAFWNGKKIGNEYLTPYCSNYDEWVQVQTFDVTDMLRENPDADLSVALGNGWYKGRFGFSGRQGGWYGDSWKLLAELHILHSDGTETVVGTDESWSVTRSKITFSNIYDGEHRDDTLPDTDPVPAVKTEAPKGALSDRLSLPVIVHEEIRPKEIIHTPAGETVADLGQNIAGSFRLRLHGLKAGDKVHVQVGEVLQNGNFYNENLRSAKAEYWYTSNGTDLVLQPQFTFYGYRYAKVEGVPDLTADDFTGLSMYSDVPQIGEVTTGDPKINRLILNAEWGKRDNFIDVPTDCPQRDERMGWTGDAEVFAPTAMYQSDAYAFYTKFLFDMSTEQKNHDGGVPVVVPAFENTGARFKAACAWSDATTIIPWIMYEVTGDPEILRRHYPSMKSWVDYVTRLEDDGHQWRDLSHFGDWLALDGDGKVDSVHGGTDSGYCAEVYYLYSTRITARAAKLIGNSGDAEKYETLAEKILEYIRYEYFAPSGRSTVDTQTGYLLALRHGLSVDPKKMAERLVEKLHKNNDRLQTGFIGTPLLAEELTENRESGLAYKLLFNEEYPGWLYEVNLGATTIWERWNSMNPDGSVSSTGMNSFNHYSYGAIAEWIYSRAAGLRRDPAVPGFRKVLFAPLPNEKLGSLDAQYDSAAGLWKSHWKVLGPDRLEVSLTVPFGCTAEVCLPKASDPAGNPLLTVDESGVSHIGPGEYTAVYTTAEPLYTEEKEA
ncbi:MAG: family 78 glycoside hydrolase catalytic domain [Lachnospiraceae bacterium]|jgi:alpha-L-rhamnosidase